MRSGGGKCGGIRKSCANLSSTPSPHANCKLLKTWNLLTRFPLKYSVQRSCWLVPDFIGVSQQSRACGFACHRAGAHGALAFPSHPEDTIGTGPGRSQAASDRIKVEIAEALAAKGGRIAYGPVWLPIGTGGNGHITSREQVVSRQLPVTASVGDNGQSSRTASWSESWHGCGGWSTYENTQGAGTLVTIKFPNGGSAAFRFCALERGIGFGLCDEKPQPADGRRDSAPGRRDYFSCGLGQM